MMVEPYRYLVVLFYLVLTLWLLKYLKIRVYREAFTGAARTILQLLIMGSILMAVFRVDSRILDAGVLLAMVTAASFTARGRVHGGGELKITFVAILAASAAVILPMTLLGAFDRVSSFLIPMSGMVIGNAMNSTALSMERIHREMDLNRDTIEVLLALGVDPERATDSLVKKSVSAALIPVLNSMKTTGLVHIPGLMTGMLLSGADPIHAAQMQAIIIYLIFIGAVLSSLIATKLMRRTYFTDYDALRI